MCMKIKAEEERKGSSTNNIDKSNVSNSKNGCVNRREEENHGGGAWEIVLRLGYHEDCRVKGLICSWDG